MAKNTGTILARTPSSSKKPLVATSGEVHQDAKNYLLTFLVDQSFKGQFYKAGESIKVESYVYETYKTQVNLKQFSIS